MSRAFIWVACGDKYIAEATESAQRAKRLMPDIGRVLLTDKKVKGPFQVHVFPQGEGSWFLNNVRYYNRALELGIDRMIALDSDAYVVAPCYEMFDALDRFDFIGAHEGPRWTAPTVTKIPDVFAEFNIGSLVFRNNAKIKALFALWLDLYEKHPDVYGDNDQAPLREALWMMAGDLQIHVMPSMYNCRFHFGSLVVGPVRILHGGYRDIDRMARIVNKDSGKARVWDCKELLRI